MNYFLGCLLVTYAVAIPVPDGLYPAPVAPHSEYGVPSESPVIKDQIVDSPPVTPSVEYGLPPVEPIVPSINEESVSTSITSEPLVPASVPVHPLPLIPTYLPFVPLVHQPLPLVLPSVPFIATSHISGFQTIVQHPVVSIPTAEVPLVPERSEVANVGAISESGFESHEFPPVPHNEYGLPIEEKPLDIPAAPALPELPQLPEHPVVPEIPVVSAPYPVPHSEYGVPEFRTTTTIAPPVTSFGLYPPSEIVSHYGERSQLPQSFLTK